MIIAACRLLLLPSSSSASSFSSTSYYLLLLFLLFLSIFHLLPIRLLCFSLLFIYNACLPALSLSLSLSNTLYPSPSLFPPSPSLPLPFPLCSTAFRAAHAQNLLELFCSILIQHEQWRLCRGLARGAVGGEPRRRGLVG